MDTRVKSWSACLLLSLASQVIAEPVVAPYSGPGSDIPAAVVRQNMLDDPSLLARVAQAEGMTTARFMGQGEGRIMQQVRKYLAAQRSTKETSRETPDRAKSRE